MEIDTNAIVTMQEADRNFPSVCKKTKKEGKAVIFSHNKPAFVLIPFDQYHPLSSEEETLLAGMEILRKYPNAFESWSK